MMVEFSNIQDGSVRANLNRLEADRGGPLPPQSENNDQDPDPKNSDDRVVETGVPELDASQFIAQTIDSRINDIYRFITTEVQAQINTNRQDIAALKDLITTHIENNKVMIASIQRRIEKLTIDATAEVVAETRSWIDSLTEPTRNWVDQLLESERNINDRYITNIKAAINDVVLGWGTVGDFVGTAFTGYENFIELRLVPLLKDAFSWLIDKIVAIIEAAFELGEDTMQAVENLLSDFAGMMYRIQKKSLQGMAPGFDFPNSEA